MPIQLDRLDTQMPATWDGINPRASDPIVDADSEARYVNGEDPVHYFTHQRVGGDLAARDLINEINAQGILDFLATRSGVNYGVPAVRIIAGEDVRISTITPNSDAPGWYVVGSTVGNLTDSENSFTLSIVRVSDSAVVYSQAVNGTTFLTSDVTLRGTVLVSSESYHIILTNTSGDAKIGFGSVILQPRTWAPP